MMKQAKRILTAATAALVGLCVIGCQSGNGGTVTATDPHITETVEDTEASALVPLGYDYTDERYTTDGLKVESAAMSGKDATYGGAFDNDEILRGDFSVTVHVTPATTKAEAGILFGAAVPDGQERFEGYALTVLKDQIFLQRIGIAEEGGYELSELARHTVGNARAHLEDGAILCVERSGNVYRFYYLDDPEGVEPWPEFELALEELYGVGVGYFDNGRGATYEGLTVTEMEKDAVEGETYLNPLFTSADPCVLFYEGVYYCYATSESEPFYRVRTSTDLLNWTDPVPCTDTMWGITQWYWAPEVIEKDGKFYMIATVSEHIGIAVADSPMGPFIPQENWLFEKSIDGHIFIDDDGRAYLYYVSWQTDYAIYGCELEEDLSGVKEGTVKMLLKARSPWETVDGGCVEGPYMLKHNGTYYLTYSGTVYTSDQYAVGYATSDSPLGDFARYEANPILTFNAAVHGPGHHSFTTDANGDLWIIYHRHNSTDAVHPRVTCIDRARFAPTASGVDHLEIYGPTSVPHLIPQ